MLKNERQAETGDDSSTQDEAALSVRRHNTNAHVVRRLESVMSKFGEAHNMMAKAKVSKEDYQPISSLMAKAKVELFNIYNELKNKP